MPFHHRRWRFHGLKNPKLRQDWNKHNLYNLSRLRLQNTRSRTFFQQKWTAKMLTRAYHGEQIKETHWKRMFDRRTPAVIPMNPKALAEDDGSKQAAGRGSGKQQAPGKDDRRKQATMPYMQMVYHPTERRLDTAIFRALFASSARQARQFVTHGHVKVNGKKMIYPGYLLNPGDLFQVEPHSVLTCTGKILKGQLGNVKAKVPSATPQDEVVETSSSETADPIADADPNTTSAEAAPTEDIETLTAEESNVSDTDPAASTKRALLTLRERAIALETTPPPPRKSLSAKQKQEVRAFRKTLKSSLSRVSSITDSTLSDLESQFAALSTNVAGEPEDSNLQPQQTTTQNSSVPAPKSKDQSPISDLQEANKWWSPKPYMSAFAFIPRYLEVNHATCSAVYLRNPVVRPGLAEVPTPFHVETGQLAFQWYLRRR